LYRCISAIFAPEISLQSHSSFGHCHKRWSLVRALAVNNPVKKVAEYNKKEGGTDPGIY
jgi:hypothetical protein